MRDTSLAAYRSLDLVKSEADLMRLVHRHYPSAKFTRKELSARTGWEINRVCGRVNALVAKGYLTEYEQTRDGGHLLSVAPDSTQEKGHDRGPVSPSHNGSNAGPADQSPGAALDQGPSRRMGHQKATTQARSATLPVASPADALPEVVAPNESMVYDDKGKPLYIAVGQGPGWPPDQDEARRRRR